jgi:phosphoglycolate phosphatase
MKPHPAPMLHACNQLNHKPQHILYIGDYETDVLASRAAGMPCIAVSYGYFPADMNPHDWKADLTIDHPKDIIKYLQELR